MWEIVLSIFAIVLFILVTLQIVFIRSTLATYAKEKYKILNNDMNIESITNTVKAYGLNINKKHTLYINDISLLKTDLKTAIPDNLYVNCGDEPVAKDVYFTGGKWLALYRNQGCNNLLQDILSKRTRYIVINNVIYIVHFDNEIVVKIRENMEADTSNSVDQVILQDQEFVYVTKLDNTFEFVDINDSAICTKTSSINFFKISPSPSTTTTTKTIIDDVTSSTTSDIPLVVIGFSAV